MLFAFLFSCVNEKEQRFQSPTVKSVALKSYPKLIVLEDNVVIWSKAGLEGELIKRCDKRSKLNFTGTVSNLTSKIRFNGVSYNEPWLEVLLRDGKKGWVYAAGVTFEKKGEEQFTDLLLKKRLETFFGTELNERIKQYNAKFYELDNVTAFAKHYTVGVELRNEIVKKLEDKIRLVDDATLPNLFWLENCLLGYSLQLIDNGKRYYLFKDFKSIKQVAINTRGDDDDRFVNLCFLMYPIDSIEYFHESWFLETSDNEGSSLLGRGIHKQILDKLNDLSNKDALFKPQIQRIKMDLLEDITNMKNTYWENKDNIIAELESILKSNYSFLSKSDIVAIQARKKMFESPEKFKIQVNLWSGR